MTRRTICWSLILPLFMAVAAAAAMQNAAASLKPLRSGSARVRVEAVDVDSCHIPNGHVPNGRIHNDPRRGGSPRES